MLDEVIKLNSPARLLYKTTCLPVFFVGRSSVHSGFTISERVLRFIFISGFFHPSRRIRAPKITTNRVRDSQEKTKIRRTDPCLSSSTYAILAEITPGL